MSKRFGRNQKRKLKAELALKEKALIQAEENLVYTQNMHQMNAEAVRLTAEVLGEYFPTLPPKTKEMGYNIGHIQMLQNSRYSMDFSDGLLAEDLVCKIMELDTVQYHAKVDKIREQMYLEVGLPSGPTVAFTLSSLHNLPTRVLEHILVRDLVPKLVEEIKAKVAKSN